MQYKILIQKIIFSLSIAAILVSCNQLNAEDLRRVADLSGYWKFSIGDDSSWAAIDFDDSSWDQIRVPNSWEREGYEEYNGFAWYRKNFKAGKIPNNEPVYLILGRIDDADEVYLNGHLIGKSGSFPPDMETAYNHNRKYLIPNEFFKQNDINTIAVRVYDSHLDGGIVGGNVGIYYDKDVEFLDYTITGNWKFHIGDNEDWTDVYLDDSSWETVNVPAEWESYGYNNYDGYGWYRKEFIVNQTFSDDDLYLCLGRIDDYDQVFLNGKPIGDVFKLRKEKKYRKGDEYRVPRTYKIPKGLLKTRGTNSLAIRVYDTHQRGGIYEGPLGIMTKSNCKKYNKKHSRWQFNYDSFFDLVFDN